MHAAALKKKHHVDGMIRLNLSQEASASTVSIRHQRTQASLRVEVETEYTPSKEASEILGYLAQSSRLSASDKRIFTRLAAFIDHYAGADHRKLMRALAGVIHLTEMLNEQRGHLFNKHTAHEMLKMYREEREALVGEQPRTVIEINFLMEQASVSMAHMTLSDATEKVYGTPDAGRPSLFV